MLIPDQFSYINLNSQNILIKIIIQLHVHILVIIGALMCIVVYA